MKLSPVLLLTVCASFMASANTHSQNNTLIPKSNSEQPTSLSLGVCNGCDEETRQNLVISLTANFFSPNPCKYSDPACLANYANSREYSWVYIVDSNNNDAFKYIVEITSQNTKHIVNPKATTALDSADLEAVAIYRAYLEKQKINHEWFIEDAYRELGIDPTESNSSSPLSVSPLQSSDAGTLNCKASTGNNGSDYYSMFDNGDEKINSLVGLFYEHPHFINDRRSAIDTIQGSLNLGSLDVSISKPMNSETGTVAIILDNGRAALGFNVQPVGARYVLKLNPALSFDRQHVSLERRLQNTGQQFSNPCDAAMFAKSALTSNYMESARNGGPKTSPSLMGIVFPENSDCLEGLQTFTNTYHKQIYVPTIRIHSDGTPYVHIESHLVIIDEQKVLRTSCGRPL